MTLPLLLRRLRSLSRQSFGVRNYASWTKILADSLNQFHENDLFSSAAAMSYFGLMALFPLLLLVLAVSQRVVEDGEILGLITQGYPGSGEFLRTTVQSLSNVGTGVIVSCVGIVLWAGTWVFSVVERALNRIWETTSRTFLHGRALSLGMMGIVGCLLSCSVLMTSLLVTLQNVAARMPLRVLHRMKFFPLVESVFWQFSFGFASILVTVALFTQVYHFLPNARVTPHDARPGALVAGFLWELAKYLFAWTLQYLHYDEIYGPVGAVVAVLTWGYVSSLILLFGSQLTAIFHHAHSSRELNYQF
jgi:membrane protein